MYGIKLAFLYFTSAAAAKIAYSITMMLMGIKISRILKLLRNGRNSQLKLRAVANGAAYNVFLEWLTIAIACAFLDIS
jgi:ABC-type branched-subunit amino acid transport system substrate-binding protein